MPVQRSINDAFSFNPSRARLEPRVYQREIVAALVRDVLRAPSGSKFLACVATGGGKRLIANDFIWRNVLPDDGRVLVVTKDWHLLGQLAADLCQRHAGARSHVGFVGGADARDVFDGLPCDASKPIVYTTVHTWAARRALLERETFSLVVIDELHWGEGAALYTELLSTHTRDAVFLGLTATPRHWTEFRLVGRAVDFAELVRSGALAQPIVHAPIRTETAWRPQRTGAHGDITTTSLRELATSPERNSKIVDAYLARQTEFGRTIVFACDIRHAMSLSAAFSAAGVRAGAIHSKLAPVERIAARTRFERGDLDVLVNVAMLTHGVDIPDIQTVFLARPTCSDILYSQMIGRGSRRALGKSFFGIVDFVDATDTFGIPIVRPDGYFGAARETRCPPLLKHGVVPAAIEVVPAFRGYEDLAGLEIQPEQTFGIEFEITDLRGAGTWADPRTRAWRDPAQRILDALRAVMPVAEAPSEAVLGTNNAVWNIKPDGSCGWELTTRILKGREGLLEVADACRVLAPVARELGLGVNRDTGTHVHLAWEPDHARVQRLLHLAAYYEPAFLSLVSPSRATSDYARSTRVALRQLVRRRVPPESWSAMWDRYTAVNLRNMLPGGYGTVEIRLHNGTLEAPKILTWMSLWMRTLAAASDPTVEIPAHPTRRLYRAPLTPGPRGDVRALGTKVGGGPDLLVKLCERRQQVVARSWANHPKFGRLARTLMPRWTIRANEIETETTQRDCQPAATNGDAP